MTPWWVVLVAAVVMGVVGHLTGLRLATGGYRIAEDEAEHPPGRPWWPGLLTALLSALAAWAIGGVGDWAVLPTYLAVFYPEAYVLVDVRILRLLRVFRIFKLTAFLSEYRLLGQAMKNSSQDTEHWAYTETTSVRLSQEKEDHRHHVGGGRIDQVRHRRLLRTLGAPPCRRTTAEIVNWLMS